MAFDKNRLKTFKWLDKISSKTPIGLKPACNSYKGLVMFRFGRLYATNCYILASIDYPEFARLGDDEWLYVTNYLDEAGQLLKIPDTDSVGFNIRDRVFEDQFIKPTSLHYDSSISFNAGLIAECMQPFKINGISPNISQRDFYLEFTGHNKEVSIRVLTIGERK